MTYSYIPLLKTQYAKNTKAFPFQFYKTCCLCPLCCLQPMFEQKCVFLTFFFFKIDIHCTVEINGLFCRIERGKHLYF